jgi:hypothetical protein
MLCVQLADVFGCVRNLVEKVFIIIIIIVAIFVVIIVPSHSRFLPSISTFVPKVIPTSLVSSYRLQYFSFYLRYSKYSCRFLFLSEILVLAGCGFSC